MLIYSLIAELLMEGSGVRRVVLHIIAFSYSHYLESNSPHSPSHFLRSYGCVRVNKTGFVSVEAILVTHLTFQPSLHSLIKYVLKKLPLI